MPKLKDAYFMTEKQETDFRVWLVKNNLTIGQFAIKAGVCRQYINQVLTRKFRVTNYVVKVFKKGGYDLE